jgi:hypothetical protein
LDVPFLIQHIFLIHIHARYYPIVLGVVIVGAFNVVEHIIQAIPHFSLDILVVYFPTLPPTPRRF